jgi:diacylglycerol kinase (ATP)
MPKPPSSPGKARPMLREATDAQKSRRGLPRLWHALRYSIDGFAAAWRQAAFRHELLTAAVMVPAAFWLGDSWAETGLLAGSVVLVLIVELLNTGVESAIDRIGAEWHPLSKQAKDVGSAAVLLALLLCGSLWAAALYHRFS